MSNPLQSIRINTIQEAVAAAASGPIGCDLIFRFARALINFQNTSGHTLDRKGRTLAFNTFWDSLSHRFPAGTPKSETLLLFLDAFEKAKTPLGMNHLEEAILLAKTFQPPVCRTLDDSAPLGNLVAVCYHLQEFLGDSPFFLSSRDAARILGNVKPTKASKMLGGLVSIGILTLVEAGRPGSPRASRFRFNYDTD